MTNDNCDLLFPAPPLMGKTVIVTGANSGLGFHTASTLARAGASVTMACRDRERGNKAVELIKAVNPDANVQLSILDLANLSSVKAFAEMFSTQASKLDILVNNAAIMALPERTLSADGYEIQFATNHLGHFALTSRLMPLLLKSSAPRVVTVSSIAHKYGRIDFTNLQGERSYEGWQAYGSSKLANLHFSFELARRARCSGSPLISLAAHPGVAKTNILSAGPRMGKKVLRTYVSELFASFMAQSDAAGALPVIYAAVGNPVNNGEFYGPDGFMQIRGNPTIVRPSNDAQDQATAARLWTVSETLGGLAQ